MLELEDIIALCGLTEEEVLAVGHHENLTEIAAAQLGNYLLRTPEGELRIKRIIKDDIEQALAAADLKRVIALKLALRGYVCAHPGCDERRRTELSALDRRGRA
jgi:hypothetical protein